MRSVKFLLPALAAMVLSASASAQTADEVINKHIEAVGGLENIKKVNTVKMEATLTTQGMDIPITIYQMHNKGMKQEINVMNMTGFVVVTNEGAWQFMPFMGQSAPEPMTAEEADAQKDGLDIQGELVDYKSKGHSVELLGKEDVDGTECYKLKLVRKSGRESTYLIDTKTYYPLRVKSKVKVNGQETEVVQGFSNYQKQPSGIVLPMTMENSGLPAPINITKVEVNPTFDASVFEVKK